MGPAAFRNGVLQSASHKQPGWSATTTALRTTPTSTQRRIGYGFATAYIPRTLVRRWVHGAAVGLRRSSYGQLISKSWNFEADCADFHAALAAFHAYTGHKLVMEVCCYAKCLWCTLQRQMHILSRGFNGGCNGRHVRCCLISGLRRASGNLYSLVAPRALDDRSNSSRFT